MSKDLNVSPKVPLEILGWRSAVRQHLTSEQLLTGTADWIRTNPEVDSVENWLGCLGAYETS